MRLEEVQVHEDPDENVSEQGPAHPSRRDTGPTLMTGLGLGPVSWDLCKWPGAEHGSTSWLMEQGWTLLD